MKKLAAPCATRTQSRGVVFNVEQSDGAVVVDYLDLERDRSVRVKHTRSCVAQRLDLSRAG